VVGAVRTLGYDAILQNLVETMRSFAGHGSYRSFLLLTLQDQGAPYKGGFDTQYFGARPLNFGAVPSQIVRMLPQLNAVSLAAYHANGSAAVSIGAFTWSGFQSTCFKPRSTAQCRPKVQTHIDLQFAKIEACGTMMAEYEQSPRQRPFDYVVKLRPDIMFIQPDRFPSLERMQLKRAQIVLPTQLWTNGPNDHFAICRGGASTTCSSLFSPAVLFRTCSAIDAAEFALPGHPNEWSKPWLAEYYERSCHRLAEYPFQYAIFRPCPVGAHAEKRVGCTNLAKLPGAETGRIIARCFAQSKEICKRIAQ